MYPMRYRLPDLPPGFLSSLISVRPVASALLVLSFLLTSCLEEIDIKVPENEQSSVVIQGKLVVGEETIASVNISRLFDFTIGSIRPVFASEVSLLNEDGDVFELQDVGQGNYRLNLTREFPGEVFEVGRPYQLRVRTFDGRTYVSLPERAVPVPKAESLNFEIQQKEVVNLIGDIELKDFVVFSVDTPLRANEENGNTRLCWEVIRTYQVTDSPITAAEPKVCYLTENVGVTEIRALDASELDADSLVDYEVYTSNISTAFGEGFYLSLVQESLSERAGEYFAQIAENSERTGSMFQSPPGKIRSNFVNQEDPDDEAFGYFYVTQHDTIRVYVPPGAVDSPPPTCPPPNGGLVREDGSCGFALCCDCLSSPNATTVKPHFWEF